MDIFRINDQLLPKAADRKRHRENLKTLFKDKHHKDLFLFLYENLNILDQKASALLQYNSIVFAAIAIFYIFATNNNLISFFYLCSMILVLISSIFCLDVVWLHWSCTEDFEKKEDHIDKLFILRDGRTKKYRIAWDMSIFSAGILLGTILYHAWSL